MNGSKFVWTFVGDNYQNCAVSIFASSIEDARSLLLQSIDSQTIIVDHNPTCRYDGDTFDPSVNALTNNGISIAQYINTTVPNIIPISQINPTWVTWN